MAHPGISSEWPKNRTGMKIFRFHLKISMQKCKFLKRNLKNKAVRAKKKSFVFNYFQKKRQKLFFLALSALFLRFFQNEKMEQ